MAQFFDLSIPYLERDGAPAAENKARKDARLRAVVRAMELGYSAVAYDRPHRGVMSDADRCRIAPFPLSSLLKAAPALASSASFHRELVGAPLSSPFRQYSRLTVAVDSAATAAALNSGNPLLRTYDLVATRPLNQLAFDHACKVSEVDLIAIDFSQKRPFRLKRPMVEAAIERGVHFEIIYSHLIADIHVRRQMLSDAKLLLDWTRGKNLIISSSASTVNEIRGPYDVANLSLFLLGLSMERAKAAISGNCRSLIANALRKKHWFKEAIRIERILPDEKVDSKRVWFCDLNDWDPLSSGEGDLPPLDDLAKFFSAASKVPKGSTAIDFQSVVDGIQSKNQVSGEDNLLSPSHSATLFSISKESGSSAAAYEVPPVSIHGVAQQNMLTDDLVEKRISVDVTPFEQQKSGFGAVLVSPSNMAPSCANAKEYVPAVPDNEGTESADGYAMVSDAAMMQSYNITLRCCTTADESNLIAPETNLTHIPFDENINPSTIWMEDDKNPDEFNVFSAAADIPKDVTELVDCIPNVAGDPFLLNTNNNIFTIAKEKDMPEEHIIARTVDWEQMDQALSANAVALQNDLVKPVSSEQGDSAVILPDAMPFKEAFDEMKEVQQEVILFTTGALLDEALVEVEKQRRNSFAAADEAKPYKIKSVAGKRRLKKRALYPAYPLPFKGLFKPMLFKKNVWRLRRLNKGL